MNSVKLLELIDSIYDSGFDHQDWNIVLEKLCHLLHANSAALIFINFHQETFRVLGEHGFPESFVSSYQLGLGVEDKTATVMMALPEGTAHGAIDHKVSKLEHPVFYDKILLPNNVGYIGALNICNNERYFVGIGMHKGMDQTQFNEDELSYLKRLYPHFRRVFDFSDILEQLKEKEDVFMSALSRIPIGVIIINSKLEVTYNNELAAALCKKDLGLKIENNHLKLDKLADQRLLKSSLIKLLNNEITHKTLQIKSDFQISPLTLMARNVESSGKPINFHQDQIILYISYPELCSFSNADSLQAVFKLTAAEAHLALSLTNGLTLQNIAEDKNISVQTVRSQLKSVFNKMNVNSQTELVRHILTSALNLTR